MTLEELKALCEAVTPGPWAEKPYTSEFTPGDHNAGLVECASWGLMGPRADTMFIAAARTLMPKLLAVAEAARSVIYNGGAMTDGNYGCDPKDIGKLADALEALEAAP